MQSFVEFSYDRVSVKHLQTCNKLMKQSRSLYNGCRVPSHWYIEVSTTKKLGSLSFI